MARRTRQSRPLLENRLVRQAAFEALRKLAPRHQLRNPVIFTVYVGSLFTTGLLIQALNGHGEAPTGFILAITLWLWFTVLFANFAEALAEGRGKARAAALRQAQGTVKAKWLTAPRHDAPFQWVPAAELHAGDIVLVEAGDTIPHDGDGDRGYRFGR